MIEKRFTHKEDDWEILDRNKHFAYAHSGYQAEKIIQELNELVETNRELYKENKQLKMGINSLKLLVQDWEALDEEKDEQLNRQSQALKKLKKENEQLKQSNRVIELILDGIVEMHDGKKDYAETIFNKAIRLLKSDVE